MNYQQIQQYLFLNKINNKGFGYLHVISIIILLKYSVNKQITYYYDLVFFFYSKYRLSSCE